MEKEFLMQAVDVWNNEQVDTLTYHHKLSAPTGNTVENAIRNADIEGVRDKIEFLNMDAINLIFPRNNFDVVICAFIFSHLWAYRINIIEGIKKVLKEGGRIVIIDNYICFTYLLLSTPHMFIYSYIRKKKARNLKKENWMRLLIDNSFGLQHTEYSKGIIKLIGKSEE